jgi:hypothetical protein
MSGSDGNDLELWDGDDDLYFGDTDRISHTMLRRFALDRPTYYATYVSKTMLPKPPSSAMRLGSFVKCIMFEPEKLGQRFAKAPDCDRRTVAGRKLWAAFESTVGERTVLSAAEVARAEELAKALLEHEVAGPLLREPAPAGEIISWTDPGTGLVCKARPAKYIADDGIVVAVRTAKSTADDSIARAIIEYGYATQAAFYLRGVAEATGEPIEALRYHLIFARSESPHVVRVEELDWTLLDKCGELNVVRLKALRRAMDTGDFRNPYQKGSQPHPYVPELWQLEELQSEINRLELEAEQEAP